MMNPEICRMLSVIKNAPTGDSFPWAVVVICVASLLGIVAGFFIVRSRMKK